MFSYRPFAKSHHLDNLLHGWIKSHVYNTTASSLIGYDAISLTGRSRSIDAFMSVIAKDDYFYREVSLRMVYWVSLCRSCCSPLQYFCLFALPVLFFFICIKREGEGKVKGIENFSISLQYILDILDKLFL